MPDRQDLDLADQATQLDKPKIPEALAALEYSPAIKLATELDAPISSKQFIGLKFGLSKQNLLFCAKINEI